ncbi:MAG: M1 family metallopeptidase [Chloroflexi bacterium]|nr:M1 family metallopeptidase [Chloroflexota bacterium]
MKTIKILCVLSVLCGALFACQATPPAPTAAPTASPLPTLTRTAPATLSAPTQPAPLPATAQAAFPARDDRSIFRSGLVLSEQGALDKLPGASVYHIDLSIGSDLTSLNGLEEVRYTNNETVSLNEIYFRLYPNLFGGSIEISHLEVDGTTAPSSLEQKNSALRIPLSPPLAPGQEAIISMDFSVRVPTEAGGNYNTFSYNNDVLALAQFYPLIPVYDASGWHIEIPPNYGDVTYTDASFFVVRLTATSDLTVAASGMQVAQENSGAKQTLTLVAGPVRDFYIAASTSYTEVSEQVGDTSIHSFAFAQDQESAQAALAYAKNAFASYNRRFGVYPYTEFDIAATATQALGVEYPGVVAIASRLYDPNGEIGGSPMRVYLESTIAHEIAHQWFYGVVGDDQVNQPWLDEAMAQYDTYLYYLDTYGASAAQSYQQSWYQRWDGVQRENIAIGMPVKDYSEVAYGAIVYGRGPIFLATLDQKMGKEKFDAFLKDYYQTYQWGIATTSGFESLAAKDCGCNLSALFKEWIQ